MIPLGQMDRRGLCAIPPQWCITDQSKKRLFYTMCLLSMVKNFDCISIRWLLLVCFWIGHASGNGLLLGCMMMNGADSSVMLGIMCSKICTKHVSWCWALTLCLTFNVGFLEGFPVHESFDCSWQSALVNQPIEYSSETAAKLMCNFASSVHLYNSHIWVFL